MKKLLIAASTALALSSPLALAGDIEAGKAKAVVCSGCHGAEGVSMSDIWPNLAGQKAGYTAAQLKAFRDGTRNNPAMSPMAKPLTDEVSFSLRLV